MYCLAPLLNANFQIVFYFFSFNLIFIRVVHDDDDDKNDEKVKEETDDTISASG